MFETEIFFFLFSPAFFLSLHKFISFFLFISLNLILLLTGAVRAGHARDRNPVLPAGRGHDPVQENRFHEHGKYFLKVNMSIFDDEDPTFFFMDSPLNRNEEKNLFIF